jgi:hypothetical protein
MPGMANLDKRPDREILTQTGRWASGCDRVQTDRMRAESSAVEPQARANLNAGKDQP